MRRLAGSITLLFFSLYLSDARASADGSVYFRQVSTADGLTHNTVTSVMVDSKGFVWAGTLNGLNRFDGYNVVGYKPVRGSSSSLNDHRIRSVYQDREDFIWIGTYPEGFDCYDPVRERYINYISHDIYGRRPYFNALHEAANGDIWLKGRQDGVMRVRRENGRMVSTSFLYEERVFCNFIFEDSRGNIWAGCNPGLFVITPGDRIERYYQSIYDFNNAVEADGRIFFSTDQSVLIEYGIDTHIFRQVSLPGTEWGHTEIALTPDGCLLLATAFEGIFCYDTRTGEIHRPDRRRDGMPSGNINIITDASGGIWLYNGTGNIWYYDPEGGPVRRFDLWSGDSRPQTERYWIAASPDGDVWIATYGNGLFRFDRISGELVHYRYDSDRNSIASDYLLSMALDSKGNIWLGTEYAGLVKVSRRDLESRIIRPEPSGTIGRHNNIRAVHCDSAGNTWLGTTNGRIYLYDPAFQRQELVGDGIAACCFAEIDGKLWVGTQSGTVYVIDIGSRKVERHILSGGDSFLPGEPVYDIERDNSGRIWIATFGGGLICVDASGETIQVRQYFDGMDNKSYIRSIMHDRHGKIWLGTADGLIRFDPAALGEDPEDYTWYGLDISDTNSLSSGDVKAVIEDSRGTVWVGTAGGGINRYIPQGANGPQRFMAYTPDGNGLAGDMVSGIVEDRHGYIWISTESGISRFHAAAGVFTSYYPSESIPGNVFNENACSRTPDGRLLFGGLDGLLVIDPGTHREPPTGNGVVFTSFSLFGNEVAASGEDSPLDVSVSYADAVKLRYDQNTFTVGFSSMNVDKGMKTKYSYRLEGYDRQWSRPSYENTASYKNLPPGRYVFKVRADDSGADDEVSGMSMLRIAVTPPWWASLWARVCYCLAAVAAGYTAFRIVSKINALNNNIRLEKDLTDHKLRFFTNISHEFRTPLTPINVAVENLAAAGADPEKIGRQTGLIARSAAALNRMIDQLLEFRKIQNNVLRLDLESTDAVAFCREIYQNFTELASRKNITYRFSAPVGTLEVFLDRRKVDKIVYNLLNNAFKFTPEGGNVTLSLENDPTRKTFNISVADTGIGIEKEKRHLLFSRFMQINFSGSGTGIGLSLVKEFVEVHKGTIWYEQNGRQGSVFNVQLPADPGVYKGENIITGGERPLPEIPVDIPPIPYEETVPSAPIPESKGIDLSRCRILIIEDNYNIRELLTEELSGYFTVDTADNGRTGLDKAIATSPDLIICDVMMPGMDGFEVTSRLKEEFWTCHIPIVMLTASTSPEHQTQGICSGADAYIMKPFSMTFLVSRVVKLIEQREMLKKRFSSSYVLQGNILSEDDRDKEFFRLIDSILDRNACDPQFTVGRFCELAKMRRTVFYNKVRGVTGLTPNKLIKVKRLTMAAELISAGELTISEISYRVGFEEPFYFSRCFKEHFGVPPSRFRKKQ